MNSKVGECEECGRLYDVTVTGECPSCTAVNTDQSRDDSSAGT